MRGYLLPSALLGLLVSGCGRHSGPTPGGKTRIRVWHVWGGTMAEGFRNVAAAFEASHPDIDVDLVFAANDLSTNQKFFTAVAAKTPRPGPNGARWSRSGGSANGMASSSRITSRRVGGSATTGARSGR